MWVKICGNTNLEDCLQAAALGADAVGFVFASGKRTVTAQQVAAITPQLPEAIEKIGVFTSGSFEEIYAITQQASLTGVQLHGAFALPLLSRLRASLPCRPSHRMVVQVLHWFTDIPADVQQQSFADQVQDLVENGSADAVLIDSRTRSAAGGTGRTFDWLAAKPSLENITLPMIVAGGLTPENVAEAIGTLHPWGVDVASGVEVAPGRKDHALLASFIANARKAGPTLSA